MATQAIGRIAGLYCIEQEAREMTASDRLALRRQKTQPLWDELHLWLRLERTRVADGGGSAGALWTTASGAGRRWAASCTTAASASTTTTSSV